MKITCFKHRFVPLPSLATRVGICSCLGFCSNWVLMQLSQCLPPRQIGFYDLAGGYGTILYREAESCRWVKWTSPKGWADIPTYRGTAEGQSLLLFIQHRVPQGWVSWWHCEAHHPNYPAKLSRTATLPDSWGGRGSLGCHTWLQTLSVLPPHFALLSFPLGIYWVLAAGPVSSSEEANYLLSEVCHHVCYLFETLKCRCFLTPLQSIIDTPRAGLNCFSRVHHGAIPSQCILMETLTFPNLCWTEWSWGRVTHRFLRFGLCMVPQRSCTSHLRDLKKKGISSNFFLYFVFKPPKLSSVYPFCWQSFPQSFLFDLIFFLSFPVWFQFGFSLEFPPIHWILLSYPKLSFHSAACSCPTLQMFYS